MKVLSAADGDIDDDIGDADWEAAHENLNQAEQPFWKTWTVLHSHFTLSLGPQVASATPAKK